MTLHESSEYAGNKAMKEQIRKKTPFDEYTEKLTEEEQNTVRDFFDEFSAHCKMQKRETEKLRRDFENAVLYYASAGIPLEKALELLDIRHLGGFYARPAVQWYALDDAAKIYPLSMKRGRMAVFRLSVYLKEPVVPQLLQMALNFTIKRFPSFATTVKKGFFWHYLDTARIRYTVLQETGIPCQPLNIAASASQTFRILWHQNRISAEFFHILTDGSGGMAFLKALTAEYLRLCGVNSSEEGLMKRDDIPEAEEAANMFVRPEAAEKSGGFADQPAVQMSGALSRIKPCRVLHFNMKAEDVKRAAKQLDATVTVYILSKIFLAVKEATDELEGDVSVQIPVNMRKFYPSRTVRNFSLYCGIRFPVPQIRDTAEFVHRTAQQLSEKSTREAMDEMMNSAGRLVWSLRFVPLVFKVPAAKSLYGFFTDGIFSTVLSNIGAVSMPEGYAEHIDHMDFVLGTTGLNRAQCSVVTFNGIVSLSISKQTADPTFEEAMYRLLAADGIIPEVEGSPVYES